VFKEAFMSHPDTLSSSSNRPTLEEWLTNPFIQRITTSEPLGWNNVFVRSTDLIPTRDIITSPVITADTLVLQLAGSTRMECYVAGHYHSERIMPGALMVYPRSFEPITGRWDSSVKHLFIELSQQGIIDVASAALRRDPEQVEIILKLVFYDPLLQHLAAELHREMQNASPFGQLFAESVANTIVLYLLRNYSNVSNLHEVSSGRLTTLQLRIVDEYIHANLHQKIALADLANCLHLSIPHFEKMFRATLHCPPYHYVLERRVERAKLLLSTTRLPLYDVALDWGFANQSHFTRHFTKFVGVSPARFMHGVRS
jgi:AraC family transcriptional regulator